MAEDRRACTLLPILNCQSRDEPPPKKPSAAEAKAAEEKKKEDEEQLRKQAMDPVKKVVGADFGDFEGTLNQLPGKYRPQILRIGFSDQIIQGLPQLGRKAGSQKPVNHELAIFV